MASLYPDDEYGLFFERLIKNAYNAEYPGAVKEDVFWIKTNFENENNEEFADNVSPEIFMFFILISIDKETMQTIITDMMETTVADLAESAGRRPLQRLLAIALAQTAAVNNLRQVFFEGF